MFHSICERADLLDATMIKQVESSIHRVAILSSIWTFGVCSTNSRLHFDLWFKTHFMSQHSSYFPSFQVRTLFDYSLVRTNETNVLLEWMLFDCNSITNSLNNINQGLYDTSTSEKRLNRSYQDMYYTTLITSGINAGTMLIPTATAVAYTLIQASLMHSGGQIVLVTGPHGSGKSCLTKQLSQLAKTITTSKLSISTASRWLCHLRDCGPIELHNHIEKTRKILLPKMLERKLYDYGTILIDDVNIEFVPNNYHSCVELLRKACETKMIYNVKKDYWSSSFQNYFVLINSRSIYHDHNYNNKRNKNNHIINNNNDDHDDNNNNSSSSNSSLKYNDRFIRHTHVLYCDMIELEQIFEKKLQRNCTNMKDELCLDLSKITFQYVNHLCESLQEINQINYKSNYDISTITTSIINYDIILSNSDKIFLKFHSKAFITSIVNLILMKVQCSLLTFTAYTSNDVIRVWDRMIAEVTLRHPFLTTYSNDAHEIANSNYNYFFPSFTNFIDREKLLRIQATENAISLLPPNSTLPTPLSYSKNIYGFFKTGVDVFPGK